MSQAQTEGEQRVIPCSVAEMWLQEGEAVILDVRTPAEYRTSHVKGSIHVPLDELGGSLPSECKGKKVLLTCRSGGRAKRAFDKLGERANLYLLENGIQGWQESGLPVEKAEEGNVISMMRQVQITAGSLVVVGVFLGALLHPSLYALAAFVGAGLVFAGVTDTCGLAMVLAKMPWNR